MAGKDQYRFATTISSAAGPTGEVSVMGQAIYVGGPASGTGSVGVGLADGSDHVFKNVPAGTLLAVAHNQIHGATHATYPTTAKDIISLY